MVDAVALGSRCAAGQLLFQRSRTNSGNSIGSL
jgi:hypothetical protein